MLTTPTQRQRPYVGRLAPSPTGRIHLGIARTALGAWLDARAHGGRLILRIEDIDRPRTVPGADTAIQQDLEWLGIDWDEGPNRGQKRGPHYQSERNEHYEFALQSLEEMARVYPCSCSRKDIALVASAPHNNPEGGRRYPGTCRGGLTEKKGRTPSIRLKTEADDIIHHTDRCFGPFSENVHTEVGDFVLRRADGMWAYQLAVAVDDLGQGVNCIVRGADLLASTARQLLLRRLLQKAAPKLETLHLPLVLGPEGARLAKRDRPTTIEELRARGLAPQQIIGALAHSLGLVGRCVPASPSELIAYWDPSRIPLSNAYVAMPDEPQS